MTDELSEDLPDYEEGEDCSTVVTVTEGSIVIKGEFEQTIALNECKTYKDILNWVMHLTRQKGMTCDVVHEFIFHAAQENGLDVQDI
jgi:hypothetical protein